MSTSISNVSSVFLLLLIGASSVLAQSGLTIGGSSFRHGQEILYSGGVSQGPQTKEVGIGIELGFTASLDEARLLMDALERFEEGTCEGTQVRIEVALRRRARAGGSRTLTPLGWNVYEELRTGGWLSIDPNDPKAESSYSWWNYELDPGGPSVRCKEHGSYREKLAECRDEEVREP